MHLRAFTFTFTVFLTSLTVPGRAVTEPNALAREYAGLAAPEAAPASSSKTAKQGTRKVSPGKTAWAKYERTIGIPLRKWAAEEIAPAKGGTVFYPFSGPDFVTVAEMFPDADRYLLVAIQPAGPVVDSRAMSGEAYAAFEAKLNAAWSKFGRLGFFRTQDLDENTASSSAPLTSTPVMMAFAASLGFDVASVRPLQFNPQTADYEPVVPTASTQWSSVRLDLTKEGRPVVVDYLCVDLSDQNLKSHPSELAWIQKAATNPVLLKAASHLLPKPYFSLCRSAIVQGTPLLVQDETGLEHPDLKRIGSIKLYGRFAGVLKLFNRTSQKDLAAAYADAGQTSPLPFAFSYQKSAYRRSLQVVRRVEKP